MPQSLQTRLLSIALAKLADYTPSTAQIVFGNYARINYARFSKLCSSHQNYATWFLSRIKTEQGQ